MSRVLKYVLSALLFGLILTPAARADSNSDLYDAVVHNDVQKVKDLLAQGADPNSSWQNPGGEVWTALHIAARNDSAEIAALLLDKGADPNIRSRNRSMGIALSSYSIPLNGIVQWPPMGLRRCRASTNSARSAANCCTRMPDRNLVSSWDIASTAR